MAFETQDFSADATVSSVLAQVNRRAARYAVAQGNVALATADEDQAELLLFVRQAARQIAIETGRVHVVWESKTYTDQPLPSWARGARVARAELVADDGTATDLHVSHGSVRRSSAPGVVISERSTATLHDVDNPSGTLRLLIVARTVLLDGQDGPEVRIETPPELEEALVRAVLASWYEELDPAAAARHAAAYGAALQLYMHDDRQTGFARTRARFV
jgi:hypothetical protein